MIKNSGTLLSKHFSVGSYFDQRTRAFDTGIHLHNALELIYTESGRCRYEINIPGNKHKTESLKPGDLILIDSGIPHRLTVASEAHLLAVEIRAVSNEFDIPSTCAKTAVENCAALKKAFENSGYIIINDFLYVKQNLLRLHSLLNTNRLTYVDNYFTQTLISTLLLNIDESYAKAYLDNPYINLIIDFIIRAYQEDISIKDIADAVNLNSSYMQKLFTKIMGNTVYDYLTQFRINQAISLMKNTNMAFEDIALEVGFNNRQTFFNAFKTYTGYSPKLFKKYLATPAINYSAEIHN